MAILMDARQQRGMALAAEKAALIERAGGGVWHVPSQAEEGQVYRVKQPGSARRTHWRCTCPDFTNRGLDCKHIWAVRFVLAVKQPEPSPRAPRAQQERPSAMQTTTTGVLCRYCSGGEVQRYGHSGRKQAYWCVPCERKFVVADGFQRLKGDPKTVCLALDLYFKGVSLGKSRTRWSNSSTST